MGLNVLLLSAALAGAAKPEPVELGYPLFPQILEGRCVILIQDMIISRRSDALDWMRSLSDKSRRIDIVVDDRTSSERCTRVAKSVVRQAGFVNVVVRRGSGSEYGPSPYFQD